MKISSLIRCLYVRTGVTVVATVSLIVLAAFPLQRKISLESEEIQKDYAKTENDQKRILELPVLRSKYQKISNESDKTGTILPESQVVELIKNLEETARETGGEIVVSQGMDLAARKKAAPTPDAATGQKTSGDNRIVDQMAEGKTLGLSVIFSGRYSDAVNFLHKVETMPYFLDVLSIDFRPADTGAGERGSLFSANPTPVTSVGSTSTVPTTTSVKATFELIVYLQ
ncbi:MAG: hypothetical protein HGA31_03780 [Candidatus Moranbacteria bacterium]|nr:hypothetical protein [Candidatus Moranbacteria bacterium]